MSARRKTALTVVLSLFVALLVAEAGLRAFAPNKFRRNHYIWGRKISPFLLESFSYHPSLGTVVKPNLRIPFETAEFETFVTTNSMGFRDDEESLDNPEVLFIGDSFCFGWGVEDDETCEYLFERTAGVRSLNMGAPGYHN